MGKIFEAMLDFFKEDSWQFYQLDDDCLLRLDVSGRNGEWLCYANADEEWEYFSFYSTCPVKTPPHQRLAMSEFLMRVNYGLRLGNFELDFSDGEIRYKTSLRVKGDRITPTLIKHLVYANVGMMDEYLPGIMAVLYGGVSPEVAVAKIEGETPSSDLN